MNQFDHQKASDSYQFLVGSIFAWIALAFTPYAELGLFIWAAWPFNNFRWAGSVGKNRWLWFFLGAIPVVNLFSFLLLMRATNNACKANDMRRGFFGQITKQ